MDNALLRKPLYGAIAPGTTAAVHISPPMQPTVERLVCVATRPDEVKFTVVKPDTIVVENTSKYPVAWGMVILPNSVTIAPGTPWAAVFADLKNRVRAWFARLKA